MANRIIKPDSGNNLVLQDEGGSDAISISTTGDITIAEDLTISAGDITIGTGGNLSTSTTGKVYSKGNCVQSSFHSSLIFGY